jgi:hypothetical protein
MYLPIDDADAVMKLLLEGNPTNAFVEGIRHATARTSFQITIDDSPPVQIRHSHDAA